MSQKSYKEKLQSDYYTNVGNGSCEEEGKDSDGRGSKGTSGPGDALLWCPRAIVNKPELRKSHSFKCC